MRHSLQWPSAVCAPFTVVAAAHWTPRLLVQTSPGSRPRRQRLRDRPPPAVHWAPPPTLMPRTAGGSRQSRAAAPRQHRAWSSRTGLGAPHLAWRPAAPRPSAACKPQRSSSCITSSSPPAPRASSRLPRSCRRRSPAASCTRRCSSWCPWGAAWSCSRPPSATARPRPRPCRAAPGRPARRRRQGEASRVRGGSRRLTHVSLVWGLRQRCPPRAAPPPAAWTCRCCLQLRGAGRKHPQPAAGLPGRSFSPRRAQQRMRGRPALT